MNDSGFDRRLSSDLQVFRHHKAALESQINSRAGRSGLDNNSLEGRNHSYVNKSAERTDVPNPFVDNKEMNRHQSKI